MEDKIYYTTPVLLVGSGNLLYTIAVCLLNAGHAVCLYTEDVEEASNCIDTHFGDMKREEAAAVDPPDRLKIVQHLENKENYRIAIAVTPEDLAVKKEVIQKLEDILSSDAVIAVNSESIDLADLQQDASHPERIIGLNWVEPALTTRFLEVISNPVVREGLTAQLCDLAKSYWDKDPYVVQDFGIRSRLISAMAREAFYLVENGYASVEDIDRACRNDAGYYLPFAGNCRYMDLMGTYAYGMVMKGLNPDLSKDRQLPGFFTNIVKEGGLGMQNSKGLYNYTDEEASLWQKTFRQFSYQIRGIMNKYPFNYEKKDPLNL